MASTTTDNSERLNLVAEKEKLRLRYIELKNKKKNEAANANRRARANSNGSFSKHLEWYEEGKNKVKSLREKEEDAKAQMPLVVPETDPSPHHICNRLYEESRQQAISFGKKKRRAIDEAREISHPSPLPSRPLPKPIPRKSAGSTPSPEEVVERLFNKNTISLEIARSDSKSRCNQSMAHSPSTHSSQQKVFKIRSSSPSPGASYSLIK
jgi:hypothetical protein